MKYVVFAALAVACAAPVSSQSGNEAYTIDVLGQGARSEWVRQVSRQLDAKIRAPRTYPGWFTPDGAVAVQFSIGTDGRPDAVTLYEGSRHRALDKEAMRAVASLTGLPALPDTNAAGQTIRANILFASDPESLARLVARVNAQEVARLARESRAGVRTLVLTAGKLRRG
jgi:TonB family protein